MDCSEKWNGGERILKQSGWDETGSEREKVEQKESKILTLNRRKAGRYMQRNRGKMGMLLQKYVRLKKDRSVSMGTLSMKIFRAASLLLLNDFISFLLIPISHPMALLWLCERPKMDTYSDQSPECKTQGATWTRHEYNSREENIMMLNWCPLNALIQSRNKCDQYK